MRRIIETQLAGIVSGRAAMLQRSPSSRRFLVASLGLSLFLTLAAILAVGGAAQARSDVRSPAPRLSFAAVKSSIVENAVAFERYDAWVSVRGASGGMTPNAYRPAG